MYLNHMPIIIKIAILIFFTIFISQKIFILSLSLLKDAGCTLKNYRDREVVFGMGIAFVPIAVVSIALEFILFKVQTNISISYLFAICVMGLFGFLDDIIGSKQIKGFKNHISSFLNGQLTTGMIKAIMGFSSSFVISFYLSSNIIDFVLNILIMTLFTNALNLMDLRPGRCTKVFVATGFLILLYNLKDIRILTPLIIMLTASLIYISYDLREVCMLGDAGSNMLGITLGYFSSIAFDTVGKTIIIVFLMSLNIAAEKISITKVISNNKLLNYLDNLGRSSG